MIVHRSQGSRWRAIGEIAGACIWLAAFWVWWLTWGWWHDKPCTFPNCDCNLDAGEQKCLRPVDSGKQAP